jgi:hypothetical protein
MKNSLVNVSIPLPPAFFVQDEYLRRGVNFNRVISVEEAKKWDKKLSSNMLQEEEYRILLEQPHWELSDFPYFLNGLRIFDIYYRTREPGKNEPIESTPSNKALSLLYIAYDDITRRVLKIENSNLPTEQPNDDPFGSLLRTYPKDFFTQASKYSIQLKPSRVLAWALGDKHIQLPNELLNVLGIYQNRSLGKNIDYLKTYSPLTSKDGNELQLLAAAQAVWFINQI